MQANFSPREKKLVILAVKAVYDAPYILFAHTLLAGMAGLSKEQISSASKEETPNELSRSELITYQTALELAEERKKLSDAS